MKISISWLQEKNACPEGIEWFREKYPEQLEGVEYQSILNRKILWRVCKKVLYGGNR